MKFPLRWCASQMRACATPERLSSLAARLIRVGDAVPVGLVAVAFLLEAKQPQLGLVAGRVVGLDVVNQGPQRLP